MMKYVMLSVLALSVAACSNIDYIKVGTRQTEIRVDRDHYDRYERCRVKEREHHGKKERRVDCRSRDRDD